DMAVDQASKQVKVEVTEGLVDLHFGGDGAQPRIHPLPAGLSVQVDASGEITSIEGEALDPEQRATSSLLAHWMLDDATESQEVLDASGNELHGILNVNSEDVTTSGKTGRAFNLRSGAYVDISKHIEALTDTSSFTFSAWIYESHDMVFSLSDGTPQNRVQFELHPGLLIYGWRQGDEFDDICARVPSWEKGRWYHVAVSISGGTATIYRDGLAVTTRSTGSKINSRTMVLSDIDHPTHAYIGFLIKNHNLQPQYLNGTIDDVQFYRRGLDERAIRYLYEHPGTTWSDTATASISQHTAHID
ncbi:MAG: LamG domain-containing protein, partial [Gammaproteobacteria bacterium]|nr:LamG domain-containing protein [Gammaproteobacteria bacterium]